LEIDTLADEVENGPSTPAGWRLTTVIRDIILILVIALAVSFVLKSFVVRPFYIPSTSMNNTLQVGDRVLVSLLTPEVTPLARGDVVVFEDPGGWLPGVPHSSSFDATTVLAFLGLVAPDDDSHLVKRVIGLPGDTVACCTANGLLTVNGSPISEPYIVVPPGQTRADKYTFQVTVPKGSLWVMGDNRNESADSAYRYHKHLGNYFVPTTDVVGRAMVINWPIGRWGYLDDYPATFSGVGHPQPVIVPQG
jgi:signal peptidase I